MPIPKPNPGESEKDFIGRCMGNPTMTSEYPKEGQRTAICYASWNKKEVEVEKRGIKEALSEFGGWIIDRFRKDQGYTEGELTYHQKTMLELDEQEGDRPTLQMVNKIINELSSDSTQDEFSEVMADIDKCDGNDTQKKALKNRVNRLKEIGEAKTLPEVKSSFWITKDVDGNMRWIGFPSNKWRDRDIPPQIISEEAHKDYVDYLERTKDYPILLSWHTPGTQIGKAQWAEYDHGFLIMGGLIDKDKHTEAERLMELCKKEAIGMSHGFVYSYADKEKEIIGKYRTWEVSHLPLSKAANVWTSLDILRKEYEEMPLSEEKKAYLVGLHGQEAVDAMIGKAVDLEKDLLSAGIEFKDLEMVEPEVKDADPQEVAKSLVESEGFKSIIAGIATLEEAVKEIKETVIPELKQQFEEKLEGLKEKAQKTADDIIADAMKSRSSVYQPSKEGPAPNEEEAKEVPETPFDTELFNRMTGITQ